MIGRLEILKHWLFSDGRERANALQLLKLLCRRPAKSFYEREASRFIKSISLEDDYAKIVFHHLANPLYWPAKMDIHGLHLIISEICDSSNWHYYEAPETAVACEDTIIDCGASEGLFSLSIAERCKKSFAIEPSPMFFSALEGTFGKVHNVHVIKKSLSDKSGHLYFMEDGIGSRVSPAPTSTSVLATTIDLEFKDQNRIDYIKADLEGHELLMLKGAVQILRRDKPKLAITTYHNKEDAEELSLFLKSVVPEYRIKLKGIASNGGAVMLHAWIHKSCSDCPGAR